MKELGFSYVCICQLDLDNHTRTRLISSNAKKSASKSMSKKQELGKSSNSYPDGEMEGSPLNISYI